MSPGRRPNASAMASMLCATGARRSILPRARGPTAILRMYMSGSVWSEPRGDDREHRHGAARAPGDDAAALDRVDAPGRPPRRPRPTCTAGRQLVRVLGADDDVPVDRLQVERVAHRPRRARCGRRWSARPSQRAPASAACSVTRA